MRSSLLMLLLLAGCPWVGQKDFDERLLEVDDDADGSPASEDCDDHDATISPAVAESWYDGIDQRCDGGDDYDQDLDGYVATEHVGLETAGVAGTGALPGGDCDDAEPMVSPQQPDTWYDGLDQDCDGADDYDQDGDGYVADEYAGLPTTYVDGSGALPANDCDDGVNTVRPGAIDDWYDGVDTDCGGEDDFDADLDGWVSELEYDNYTETTYVDGSGRLPNGDCDDTDPAINPVAEDEWYDGIDADCAEDDDYDQDLDGYLDESGGGDDCDDTVDTTWPGATETLGDSVDSDCDGQQDTFSLESIEGFTWVSARAPTFAESDERIYLSVAGDEIDTGTTHYYDSALALVWDNTDPTDGRDGVAAWSVTTTDQAYTLSAAQGFAADSDYLYGALGYEYAPGRSLRLVRYDLATGSRTGAEVEATLGTGVYEDIAVTIDDEGAFDVVGCEDEEEILHYVRMGSTWSGGVYAETETADIRTSDCAIAVFDGASRVFTSERGTVWEYTFDYTSVDPLFVGVEYSDAYAPLDLEIPWDWDDRTLVMADATTDSVVFLDALGATSMAVGDVPTEVDSDMADDGTVVVGWLTPGGDVHLGWGTFRTGFTEVELDAPFAASDVAVHASGDFVIIAATTGTDVAVGIARR